VNKKTTGAWIIHHSRKLEGVANVSQDYEQIILAGKCGTMLNALAASVQVDVTKVRLHALAKANGISVRFELPAILNELQKQRLIDHGDSGLSVLGLTTVKTLEHTATIFEESSPDKNEKAAIEVSEMVSDIPIAKSDTAEYLADNFSLSNKDTNEILKQYEQIGFFDSEVIDNERLYFNGNLFRHEEIMKVNAVLSSLRSEDKKRLAELSEKLNALGCIPKREAIIILGDILYSKVCAIGFIDENTIGNEAGMFSFVTLPAAFSKFTNSIVDDAFDLAKAFVTSLTYGMTSSPHSRGRITMIEALMKKLISGSWVGPATAIGQDYKVLEVKGVLEVKPTGDGRYFMRLLKKDVGRMALMVITAGEASTDTLLNMPSVSATKYEGPEVNRVIVRKQQTEPLRKGVAMLLNDLRTGGIR